jgi:hypothetical protein
MTKEQWKQALIAILIGAAVTFISSIINGLLELVKDNFLDLSGAGASMVYYLKSRRTT